MDQPILMPSRRVGTDTDLLSAYAPLPGLGVLPINAFLIHAREPVLVDTGIAALRERFLQELRARIDPAALRWIWITHVDADHVGNLAAVLAEAPQARVVTNYLGAGKMGLQQLPLSRTHLINPGQSLDVGDRQLLACRPPVYDAPETMAVFDSGTRHLFSSDCFGAVMTRPAETASAIEAHELNDGLALWARIDAPWLSAIGRNRFAEACRPLRDLQPRLILGSHLPPAAGLDDALYAGLDVARETAPFVGPDQAAIEQLSRVAEPVVL